MKHLLIIPIFMLLFIACSSDEQNLVLIEEPSYENTMLDNDSLIINLKNLNDSLILEAQINEGRGFRDFFRFLNGIAIVAADIKGIVDGAKWGGSILGIPGAIVGAGVVGATYSTLAYLSCDTRSSEYYISKEKMELAYVNAKLNNNLRTKECLECSVIDINLPQKYMTSKDVGVLHNVTLRIIEEDLPLEYKLEDGLTKDEIRMLQSDEFVEKYNYSLNHPKVFSIDYMSENITKEDKIIQLFLEVFQEYPSDMEDINYLINKYIELIESDAQITELQKEAVYFALSTAAYSTNYWYSKSQDSK